MKKAIAFVLAFTMLFGLMSGCTGIGEGVTVNKTYKTMSFDKWLKEGNSDLYLLSVKDESDAISSKDFEKLVAAVNPLSSALPTVPKGKTVKRADAFLTLANFFSVKSQDDYFYNLKLYKDIDKQSSEVKSAFNALAGLSIFDLDAPSSTLRPESAITWGELISALNILKPKTDSYYQGELSEGKDDDNTVCLWLFDEPSIKHSTLTDASQNAKADLGLMTATTERGLFGKALRITPDNDYAVAYHTFIGAVTNDYMRTPDDKNGLKGPAGLWGPTEGPGALLDTLEKKDLTVEFWIRIMSEPEGEITLFDAGQSYDKGFSIKYNYKNAAISLEDYYGGYSVASKVDNVSFADGKWHHLALTAKAGGAEGGIFIDGKPQTDSKVGKVDKQALPDLAVPKDRGNEVRGMDKMDMETRRQHRFNISLGQDRALKGDTMDGYIDELRVSDVVRYTTDFNPPSTMSRNLKENTAQQSQTVQPLLFPSDKMDIKADSVIKLEDRKYVFIDTALFDTVENAKVNINKPEKEEPITGIKNDPTQGSAIAVDGKIYYYTAEGYSGKKGNVDLYISDDGLNFKYYGPVIKDTPNTGGVFIDTNPNEPAERRIKYTCWIANRGIYTYYSADGIHFTKNECATLPLVSGGSAETFYDNQRNVYVQFLKRDSGNKTRTSINPGGRVGIRFEAPSLLQNWPFKRVKTIFYEGWWVPGPTDEAPIAMGADETGQLYRARAYKYENAPDTYISLAWRFLKEANPETRLTDLGVSRDGIKWDFFKKTTGEMFLDKNEKLPEVITSTGIIYTPDKLYFYGLRGGAHGDLPRNPMRFTQRVDGFTALEAGATEGHLVSKPMTINGDALYINVKSSGYVKFQLTDEKGNPIKGFTFADCSPVKADKLDYKVSFKGGSLSALKDKVIKVEIKMANAKLYAMQFR